MAKNFLYGPHRTASLPVPSGTKSGDPVMVGQLIGVALTDRRDSGNAMVGLDGVAELLVGTTTTRAIGDPVYFVTSTGALTTTDNSGANPVFGYAREAKGATVGGEVIAVELAEI